MVDHTSHSRATAIHLFHRWIRFGLRPASCRVPISTRSNRNRTRLGRALVYGPVVSLPKRFQIELLPDQEWIELRRRVQHAEQLGFDVASTADQFVDWTNPTIP